MTPPDQAHLLIVDDDALLRGMAASTLEHAGFAISEAVSGEEAMVRVVERPYDLILLDVMMPGLDGYQVCERIRAIPERANIPILMLTGLNDTASIELAYAHGATDFIIKPINWTLLSHKVRYALRASSAAEATRRAGERLARAQRLSGMGHWTVLPDGRMEVSAELLQLFGLAAEGHELTTADQFLELVLAADRETVRHARARALKDGTPYQLTFRVQRPGGLARTVFEQATALAGGLGNAASVEGITQDITERVQAQERIQQLAHYDVTTGLPNRQFFVELAGPSLERSARNGTGCALMHIDIDRFKAVNDAFGRSRGDIVLREIAERLRACTRSFDLASADHLRAAGAMLASVGGNAFTMLIADLAGQEQAALVADRLLMAMQQPFIVESQSLVLTASIGIALYPGDATHCADLTRCAEQAVHAAKEAGRAQYRFFDEQTNARAESRLLLELDLRRAIEQDELQLHFQPKIDTSSGAIIGAEGLVRWRHSARGLVQPDEFIGVAEETGLILPLTDWVLERACRSLREWRDAGLPSIPLSVNLSAPSFADDSLIGKLDSLMRRFDLRPHSLILEMTETVLMRDIESGSALLQKLRARGYGLSLDDFGTGYSSLSYLTRLPLDELKIDRAFITDAVRGGREGALATAIIALGRELGLQVVAEGVETWEQSNFLLRRGCNVQQGYLFSRPVAAMTFVELLRVGHVQLGSTDPSCEDVAELSLLRK
jgi:diguanylate cyclase (GGDEF)-like protein/PAS domain S-box-containing protein